MKRWFLPNLPKTQLPDKKTGYKGFSLLHPSYPYFLYKKIIYGHTTLTFIYKGVFL